MKTRALPIELLAVWSDVISLRQGARLRAGALSPQPSLRVPATPANRESLRRLRAAEAEAWEAAASARSLEKQGLQKQL